jgi:signal transduction histidine kinase
MGRALGVWRRFGRRLDVEIVLALIASAVAFVLAALVSTASQGRVPALLLGFLFIAAVLAVARVAGVVYAIPVGLVTLQAYDWYFLPPYREIDLETAFVLGVSIVTSVLVAEIASHAGRRAEASEQARGMLADEQEALRRVATLVARGVPPAEVFASVAEEVGRLVSIGASRIIRYEEDGSATVVSVWREAPEEPEQLQTGVRLALDGESITAAVLRTGLPARMDSYARAAGPIAALMRDEGVRSSVGAPIVVEGRLWGVIAAGSTRPEPIPAGMESRLAQFTELVAMAIANAEARAELAASRARVVAASDATRRRIERDLHDSIQQRLVSLALKVRATQMMKPQPSGEIQEELALIGEDLGAALDEIREISRGIHPAVLSEAGLGPALKALARRSAIPIALDLDLPESRLDEPLEAAAYYVVSEALTNAVKHAHATVVELRVELRDGALSLSVSDDGIGGADPSLGSGIIGITDRVGALGGTISVVSPSGDGTTLHVQLPVGSAVL